MKEHAGGSPGVVLTRREIDVAEKLSEGKEDKLIAAELGIASGTLRSYINTLFLKLKPPRRTRTGLAIAFMSRHK
jgi:DNA-binding NarL/FixJ family response regulator